jgi:pilus assembly protein CpaF
VTRCIGSRTSCSWQGHLLPDRAIREQIATALHLVVHIARLSDGSRRILSIQELLGMEGPIITMQEIFRFRSQGLDARVV